MKVAKKCFFFYRIYKNTYYPLLLEWGIMKLLFLSLSCQFFNSAINTTIFRIVYRTFGHSSTSAGITNNSCFARVRYTFLNIYIYMYIMRVSNLLKFLFEPKVFSPGCLDCRLSLGWIDNNFASFCLFT